MQTTATAKLPPARSASPRANGSMAEPTTAEFMIEIAVAEQQLEQADGDLGPGPISEASSTAEAAGCPSPRKISIMCTIAPVNTKAPVESVSDSSR